MSKTLEITSPAPVASGYGPAGCRAAGPVTSAVAAPAGFTMWAVAADLGPGGELTWDGGHGDELVYVRRGTVRTGEQHWPAGSAVVVEADAPGHIEVMGAASIVHFGSVPGGGSHGALGPPATEGRRVHGVGPGSRHLAHAERADRRLEARFYFDSTCPTCRVTLLRVSTDAGYRTPSHLHSEDELILVTRGSVATGRQVATPGQVVAIPGERRYALVAGAEGCEFLNFRSDISYLVGAPGDDPVLETAENQGAVPVDEWAVG